MSSDLNRPYRSILNSVRTMSSTASRQVTDLALSRRLERTEACSNAAFVEARATVDPSAGAAWRDVGGTYAMFDGVGSPITQTFGLGLFSTPTEQQLEEIEEFFQSRGAEVNHEVSPIADPELLALLPRRGYHPIELSTVLHCSLAASANDGSTLGGGSSSRPALAAVATRIIAPHESEAWADLSAQGWAHAPEVAVFLESFGRTTAASRGVTCFVAELEGEAIATGAIAVHNGVALLAGASTRLEWRGRGAQSALLNARLQFAIENGCDLAMMAAAPGSTSQLNAERQGFSVAYTRIKWKRA